MTFDFDDEKQEDAAGRRRSIAKLVATDLAITAVVGITLYMVWGIEKPDYPATKVLIGLWILAQILAAIQFYRIMRPPRRPTSEELLRPEKGALRKFVLKVIATELIVSGFYGYVAYTCWYDARTLAWYAIAGWGVMQVMIFILVPPMWRLIISMEAVKRELEKEKTQGK